MATNNLNLASFRPPPQSHARAQRHFCLSADLERDLRQRIRGVVRFDPASRALYATDASVTTATSPSASSSPPRRRCHRNRRASPPPQRSSSPVAAEPPLRRPGLQRRRHLDTFFQIHERHGRRFDPVSRTVRVQPGIVLDCVWRSYAENFAHDAHPTPPRTPAAPGHRRQRQQPCASTPSRVARSSTTSTPRHPPLRW